MKLIVLISFACLTRISGLDYPALFTLNEIQIWTFNKFFHVYMQAPPAIREVKVKKVITEEDQISVDYRIETIDGSVLKSGENASYCGDDVGTEGGSIAEAVRKIFAIEESNCPIAMQTHTFTPGNVEVTMQNTDIDTNCERFYVHAMIRVRRSENSLSEMDFSVTRRDCAGN